MKEDTFLSKGNKEVIFSPGEANLLMLWIVIPILLIYCLPFYLLWGLRPLGEDLLVIKRFPFLSIIVFLAGIVLHELLHGLTWAIFCKKGFKAISFGVHWKSLTPFANCSESLSVKQYALGGAMPAIILGVLPALCGVVIGNGAVFIFGLIFTVAAGGDILVLFKLLKVDQEKLIKDHPEKIGFIILEKNSVK